MPRADWPLPTTHSITISGGPRTTEQWLADLLARLTTPEHRRLVHTFATWRVMRRRQVPRRPRITPDTQWLFPGLLPGRPITASRLADRLRTLGVPTQPARRAAALAELLNLHPTTAVKWMHHAGGDWTRYAAEIARTRNHQPRE